MTKRNEHDAYYNPICCTMAKNNLTQYRHMIMSGYTLRPRTISEQNFYDVPARGTQARRRSHLLRGLSRRRAYFLSLTECMMYTYHHELTDQHVHDMGDPALSHNINNLRQIHGSTVVVECKISGDGTAEVQSAHLGDHDITDDDHISLDDLIDYGEMVTEVRESAKEEHEAAKAEAKLDSRRWRGEEVCPRGYDGR